MPRGVPSKRVPPTTDGTCFKCGGHVAVFEFGGGSLALASLRKCAKCRVAGARTRTEHALRLSVERALAPRKVAR